MVNELQNTNQFPTSSTAHIISFPAELLIRIFQLACDSNPSFIERLALVCSHWRFAALGFHAFWSRIVCHPHPPKGFNPEILSRAQAYVSRSGEMPLDFELSAESGLYNSAHDDRPVESLCKLVGPRMRSLNLEFEEFPVPERTEGIHRVLSTLLSHCVPGTLIKLVITDPDRFGFITTTEAKRVENSSLKLSLKYMELNRIFSSIRILHLIGLFPQWSSHAYYGLVDIRLCAASSDSNRDDNTIPEAQLVEILKASPGLRTLHFELRITARPGEEPSNSRVRLAELEVLRVESSCTVNSFCHIENFLRLLEPGQKPLHLFIANNSPSSTEPSATETKAFFARSKVTKLFMAGLPQLFEPLPFLPHLKILFLSGQQRHPNLPAPSDRYQAGLQNKYPRLEMLFLLRCRLALDETLALVQLCRPRTTTLYDNDILENQPHQRVRIDTAIVEKRLSIVCSDVQFTEDCPDWDKHEESLSDI